MKERFLCLAILILLSDCMFSQQNKFSAHGSQIQVEILGPGGMFSFDFESRFAKRKDGLGFKVGLGAAPYGLFEESCNTGAVITIPIGLNYLVGKKDHFLELGAGNVFMFGGGTKVYCTEIEDSFFESGEILYMYSLIGYRYQPASKKISWRVFISPLFQKDFPVKFWGGAGIGFRLKAK